MIRALRRFVIRARFKKLVKSFDDRIEEARAKHQPVRPIQKAKSDFVRQCLEGRR
jgi:hypothetical protein